MDSTKLDQRPQPAADADADAVGSGSTSSLPVTKGRFKVKHVGLNTLSASLFIDLRDNLSSDQI